MKFHVSAVIAAAGFSSRMGQFKPLLPLGGVTAVERVIGAFAGAGVTPIIVVGGHRWSDLAGVVSGTVATCSFHPDYPRGMFSSFQHGIGRLPEAVDAFFAHPVDIPLISAALVRCMIDAFEDRPGIGIYPCFKGTPGRPALIPGDLREEITRSQDKGGLRTILEMHGHRFRCIEAHHPGILLDMDTTQDYLRLQTLIGTRPL